MPLFLAPDWFERLASQARGVVLPSGTNGRIQFDAGGQRFALVIEGGCVTRFDSGELDRAEVELRFTPTDAARVWRRDLCGDDAMRAGTVVAPVDDGVYTGPPAPGDLLGRRELDRLPTIPDASLLVAYTLTCGPFGDVHHWIRFENGKPVGDGFGEVERADVRVGVPYLAVPLVRTGECTILEMLEEGSVEGELGPLALLAGILESAEFRAAEVATGRHGFALSALGDLWVNPAWSAALDELADETTPT